MARIMVKKGTMGPISSAILISLAALVVISIIAVISSGAIGNLGILFETYKRPDLKFTNNYEFTATRIGILSTSEKCSDPNPQNIYYCPTGTSIDFKVNVYNGGLKMRAIYATPTICLEKDCKGKIFDVPQGPECSIVPGETIWCNSGAYRFETTGKYRVFPGAYCLLDAEYGCYTSGLSGPVRSDNADNWITVIIEDPVN